MQTLHPFLHQLVQASIRYHQTYLRTFKGKIIVGEDGPWGDRWAHSNPVFYLLKDVKKGQTVDFLVFFYNPRLGEKNIAEISCETTITDPKGKVAFHSPASSCFHLHIQPSSTNFVFLVDKSVTFMGDADDPDGVWKVSVSLRDQNSGISIPLETNFYLH